MKRDIDPAPPGDGLLEDVLKPMGMSQYRLAKSIGVPASCIHDVVPGKRPITAELAPRLARFFGTDAQSWVNLQAHDDLERAEIEPAARVKKRSSRTRREGRSNARTQGEVNVDCGRSRF